MNRYTNKPRRLRVSALAAVANPSYARIDTWNLLDDACRHLAEVDLAGLDKTHDLAKVKRLMDRIGAYERYWLFPGADNLATFRGHLESLSTVRLTEEVSLAVRLLSEYGDRAGLFDTSAPLADQELVAQAKQQHFYTVLLADDAPTTAPDSLAESLRALRCSTDDIQFEVLVVPSVEDAITAVALNGEIQAAIIRDDLCLRSHDRVPLMNTLLGPNEDVDGVVFPDRANDWVECGEWIRELRPHIDLYLLTDESIAACDDTEPDVYDRTFYRLNDVTDLYSTVLAGLRNRYHFSMPCGPMRRPPSASSTRCPSRGAPASSTPSRYRIWAISTAATFSWPKRHQPRAVWIRCWTRTATSRRRWTRPRTPGIPTTPTSSPTGRRPPTRSWCSP
jgi:hypothetical protein